MNPEAILAGTASLFLALGDKTRLRLLNLMRDREVNVSSFTGILEQSQPLVSRHLAYLRNSGIVEARRDGKWMHYSISAQLDENSSRLLSELFKWMESQDGLRVDREKYRRLIGEPSEDLAPGEITERKSSRWRAPKAAARSERTSQPMLIEPEDEREAIVEAENETYVEPDLSKSDVVDQEDESYPVVYHNELEDFLL